jgi:threonine/homoserine/homoserine lactone efflux protein
VTLEQALAFFLFSIVAAATPGPSNVLLTATGANVGVWRGLPCLLGVSLGMGLMMFVVAFGVGSLILDHPTALQAVKWCGATVLVWLAWKIATARRPGVPTTGRPAGFLGGATFQWVNPKSWLVAGSAAATFLDRGAGGALGQAAAFGLVFVLASLPGCYPWLAFGAVVARFLRSERAWRVFNGVMGALLAASVVLFVR